MAMASCFSHISNATSLSFSSPLSSLPSPHKLSLLPLSYLSPPPSSSSRLNHYSSPPKSPSHHRNQLLHLCNAAGEYVFPDPIPEFADAVSFHHFFLNLSNFSPYFPHKNLIFFFPLFWGCFGIQEMNKFRTHLLERLTKKKKDLFGDSIDDVVSVCTEVRFYCNYSW